MNAPIEPKKATQVSEERRPFELAAGKLDMRVRHAQTLLDDINRLIAARTGGATPDRSESAIRAINDASERLHVALVQFQLVQWRLASY